MHRIGPLSSFFDEIGIEYIHVPCKSLSGEHPSIFNVFKGVIVNFIKIRRFIIQNGITLVHGNDLRINLTWSIVTKFLRCQYVWHQRTPLSASKKWRLLNFICGHVITISKYVDNSIPNNIQSNKKSLILNPFNTELSYDKSLSREYVESLYKIPKNCFLLGFVGRLVDWKNVDQLLIDFSNYIYSSKQAVHLLIVGSGDDIYVNKIKKMAVELSIENFVTFVGFYPYPSKILSSLDCMVAPSNCEPFGRTLVESMLQKTPVLAVKKGGHKEIIENYSTGIFYEHKNSASFISGCNFYINSPNFRRRIASEAYNISRKKFPSEQHMFKIKQIYKSLHL